VTAAPRAAQHGVGDERGARAWIALALLLFAGGAALRLHNASAYWLNFGFDGSFNWEYVYQLTKSWELPHPEEHWSAARPPLFFYVSGALARTFGPMHAPSVHAIRVASSAFGLLAIALCAWFVRREATDGAQRMALTACLLLFLPVHIYMSAMLNEEIAVASFSTVALVLAVIDRRASDEGSWASWLRVGAIGLAGGLAFLTKLTGCLVVVGIALAMVLDGWREAQLRRALLRAGVLSVIALVTGGWFYARSLVLYGYLYPESLDAHQIMLSMPPGERGILDYLRFPLSTFTNPRVDSAELVRSVWGSTYATLWFDGQRHFVPRSDPVVDRMGFAITVLALLPSAAFLRGAVGGLARVRRSARSVDAPMLAVSAITLAGYAFYTWRNPWFATVKGGYLLGLCLPFAWWTSETLARWARGSPWLAAAIWLNLALLVVAVTASFTFGTPLWTMTAGRDMPGLPWLPGQP
jgi:4-amino-4-deoxy-L-arabinose transferase-like glycosyltransferase